MPTFKEVLRWREAVEAVAARIGERFGRREQREHAGRYLRGLLARVERKNGWHACIPSPNADCAPISPPRTGTGRRKRCCQLETVRSSLEIGALAGAEVRYTGGRAKVPPLHSGDVLLRGERRVLHYVAAKLEWSHVDWHSDYQRAFN
jgi:hypothetical protein